MKYIIWILAGAVLFLGFSQWRSCTDHTAANLTAEKKVIQHQRDSIQALQVVTVVNDSLLRIAKSKDSIWFAYALDSLNQKYKAALAQRDQIKAKINDLVAKLAQAVLVTGDSGLIAQVSDLKDQIGNQNNVIDYLQMNSSQRDSLMQTELNFRDSVINAQNIAFNNLRSNYNGMLALLDKANADLDVAIKQLQKGKRVNLLRTFGEAILLTLLILKK